MNRPHDVADDRWLHWLLLSLSLLVLILSLVLRVQGGSRVVLPVVGFALPETCAFKQIVDTGCPGCGLTRSFISLAHGQWSAAWRYNAVGPLLFTVVLLQVPYRSAQLWRLSRRRPAWQYSWLAGWLLSGLCAALLLQWLVRLFLLV